jgi:phosphoadenosine phosphosulfate reductase
MGDDKSRVVDFSLLEQHPGRSAVSFSGGKDSTLLVWLLREAGRLGDVTVYHTDPGDFFPELREHIAEVESWCPNFIRIQTNSQAWGRENGWPSDLVPHSSHFLGQQMEEGPRLSARYDCCFANLMWPLYSRIKADGHTLLLRGTRRSDMKRLPVKTGDNPDGVELFYPIQEWTEDQVFAFVKEHGVPLPRYYDHFRQGPDCARCTAWWGENRAAYLRDHHPELFMDYQERMTVIAGAVARPLLNLQRELQAAQQVAVLDKAN